MRHEPEKNAARDSILAKDAMSGKSLRNNKTKQRVRSDLVVREFGASTRSKDRTLSGSDLSPHWNEKNKVLVVSIRLHLNSSFLALHILPPVRFEVTRLLAIA